MYLSVHAKAANAYRNMGAVTQLEGASPGHLLVMLFENLHAQLLRARQALSDKDIAEKGLTCEVDHPLRARAAASHRCSCT